MADAPRTSPPIQTPSSRKFSKEVGFSGTRIYNGMIVAEDYNVTLTGQSGVRKYEIMRRSDGTVRAALLAVKLPILATQWQVIASGETTADLEATAFINHELFGRNVVWPMFQRQALTELDFGYSIFEKTLGLTVFEGKTLWGIDKLGYRKQTSLYSWETEDKKPGITQQLNVGKASIPREKLIVFTHDREGDNYEGISLLRYCYKHWDIKDKLDIINAMALEKFAMGVPVLRKPANANEGELEQARLILQEFRANEKAYLEIPGGDAWDVEIMDMKAGTTKDLLPTIVYHDRQIMKSVLAQFLELGGDSGSGSRAVSEDHSKLFMHALDAVAKSFQQTIQDELIKQLCDVNFSNLTDYPKLTYNPIGDDDVAGLADSTQKFANAGFLHADAGIEDQIRSKLHLPALTEDQITEYDERAKAETEMRQAATELAKNPEQPAKKTKIDPKEKKDLEADVMADAKSIHRRLVKLVQG